MAMPELIRRSGEKILSDYCREKTFSSIDRRIQLDFVLDTHGAILFVQTSPLFIECWKSTSVARFRFVPELNQWTLHYPDGQGNWCFYLNAAPSLDLGKLLRHLDENPFAAFPLPL